MKKRNFLTKAILSLLIVAMLVSSLAFSGCSWFNDLFGKPSEEPPAVETPAEPDEPEQPGEPGNESSGVIAMPRAMTFTSTIEEPETNPGILIQATITPEWASNKELDWSVEFTPVDGMGQQSWVNLLDYNGKTIENYFTVTPTSDGASTAYIKCLDIFESQITLTATLRYDTTIKATCKIDYAKKLANRQALTKKYSDGSYEMGAGGRNPAEFSFYVESPSYDIIKYTPSASKALYYQKDIFYLGGGSIETEVSEVKMYLRYSEELKTAFAEYGLTLPADNSEFKIYDISQDIATTDAVDISGRDTTFYSLFGIQKSDGETWVKLRDALASIDSSISPLQLVYRLTTPYETKDFYRNIKIDTSTMIKVESVTLNNSNLVF